MRLFIFKSGVNENLRAFAADLAGQRLPDQFRPWTAVGAVAAEAAMPHNFERAPIEKAVTEQGFQLWRFKPVAKSGDKATAKPAAKPVAK